jgi:hypothetical protein
MTLSCRRVTASARRHFLCRLRIEGGQDHGDAPRSGCLGRLAVALGDEGLDPGVNLVFRPGVSGLA